jgi:hypothetical protein
VILALVEFVDPQKDGGVGKVRIILRIILMFLAHVLYRQDSQVGDILEV